MTNEEAIYVLKNVGWIAPSTDTTVDEAIEMACKALAEQTEPKCEECQHYGHKVERCLLNKCKYE